MEINKMWGEEPIYLFLNDMNVDSFLFGDVFLKLTCYKSLILFLLQSVIDKRFNFT